MSSPLGSLGRGWRNQQEGPCGVLTGRSGCWVTGERGSGWACGWGPLRGSWEGLISGGLTRVEIRPGRLRTDPAQVWDASNRLWHPGPEAFVQRGRSGRLTLHPCKAVPATGPDGGVWAEEVKGQGGRRTGSRRSHVSNAHGQAPAGWSPFPAWLAVCPTGPTECP